MSLLECNAGLRIFEGLKSYSRADVELINRSGDLFGAGANWQTWVQEGLGALLEAAGERVIVLEETNQVDSGETRTLSFQKDEIGIGREQDNDVVIPSPGVGRHHARITKQHGRYFVEDLGSANGTYLNDVRIEPHQSVPLNDGAQFLIFPHHFTFSSRQVWSPELPIRVSRSAPRVTTWHERWSKEFGGTGLFSVKLSPDLGSAVLRVPEDFLKILLYRISHAEIDRLIPADSGLFEFLLLSVLERANRELGFPFRFSLVPFEALQEGEAGISVEYMIGLTGATGAIEIFLPARLLRGIQHSPNHNQLLRIPASWPVMATCGYSDLTLQELAALGTDDILLIASAYKLLLPASRQGAERGWRAVLAHSSPPRFKIQDYFEGSDFTMDSQAAPPMPTDSQKPNLAALPVRVHIVLSQLDMTLAELNQLSPGSILELDRTKSEYVQLAVNGKLAGEGELVEIEGRLGVRIANWNSQ